MHPGAAATVGSDRISVAQLNAAVARDTSTSTGQLTGSARAAAVQSSLSTLIDNELLNDAAKAKGITVTETEIQSVLATQRQTNGTDEATATANGIPFADLHQVVQQAVLIDKLEAAVGKGVTDQNVLGQLLSTYLVSIAKQQGVSVNPRYGIWQAANLKLDAGDAFTSLQSPAASAPAS